VNKFWFCFFFALQALLFSACDMFNVSLADYLREFPTELRLQSIYVEYDGKRHIPQEAPEPGRDNFTIFVPPQSPGDTGVAELRPIPADPSTTALPIIWNAPSRPSVLIEGHQYLAYRPDETKTITLGAANGLSHTYTVNIIWAEPIDHPDQMNDIEQDYYLKPGPAIVLNDWIPIGTDAAYSTYGPFSGSLRGGGRTLEINNFRNTPSAAPVESQGLFALLDEALVEDLHVRLNAASNTKIGGGIAGIANRSLIRRVKVSGGLSNRLAGSGSGEISVGGIAGTLASGAMIHNSIASAHISGFVPAAYGSGNFYIGAAAGRVLDAHTTSPFALSPGGYIINTLASGDVITDLKGGKTSVAGGIAGGGGSASNTDVKGCVVVSGEVNAGAGGFANRILGQWGGGPGAAADNYYRSDLVRVGKDPPGSIQGTPLIHDYLKTWAAYNSLGWDNGVWKMGLEYPALLWE
jgi:hypothetical protein